MKVLLLVALVVLAHPYSWQDYKAEFGKSYLGSED